MIKHRVFTLEVGLDNEDICDERLDACLNDGWRIVSYLPNVIDDSNVCNEPGSVYTEVMVVLAKDDKAEVKAQEEHAQDMRVCRELMAIADRIVDRYNWGLDKAIKATIEMYTAAKGPDSRLDKPFFKWEKSDA